MTTWAASSYQSHPWFRMPSLKRKDHSDDSESSSGSEHIARSPSPPRTKRRRCDLLEKGLAQLDLNAIVERSPASAHGPTISLLNTPLSAATASPATHSFQGPPPWHASTSSGVYAAQPPHPTVVFPESVEEPTSPEQAEIQDVRMKIPSWYEIEKDRIVVTDLEDSDTEGSDADASAEHLADVTVSPALLQRIARHNDLPIYARNPVHADPSKALVLFRSIPKPDVAADANEPTPEPVLNYFDDIPLEERFAELDSDTEVMMDTSPLATPPPEDAMDIEPL
ncbi:hypothetical protein CERSUDRAFT_114090 [Gelatoporia subvermispora B]|uniref:Uncharacterized protein n=1 Tax=Ceriporiopsis subvermispora (strain B) TaxID=914234 RepID=M2QZ63_CERS8|nr:hypothetical protein CERSUDRAFT_114090 [Gelatoporia subvermispora B]